MEGGCLLWEESNNSCAALLGRLSDDRLENLYTFKATWNVTHSNSLYSHCRKTGKTGPLTATRCKGQNVAVP